MGGSQNGNQAANVSMLSGGPNENSRKILSQERGPPKGPRRQNHSNDVRENY